MFCEIYGILQSDVEEHIVVTSNILGINTNKSKIKSEDDIQRPNKDLGSHIGIEKLWKGGCNVFHES